MFLFNNTKRVMRDYFFWPTGHVPLIRNFLPDTPAL